jgi:hypothetical protein
MAQAGYIFGKGTPDTYESLQSKRRTAERFGLAALRTPQNLGEGLSSWGQAIAYRRLMNQADAGDAAGRAAYDEKRGSVLGALMGGALGGSAPAFNPGPSMPVTANPAGLDPSIIKAVDRVNPQGREAEIRAGLIQRGMAPHIADGFLMNFKDESGLDPGINEAAPIVPGSRGGFGLAQWTGPRRVALEKFAAARGAAPSDANVQLDFLMTELQGPESRAARNIFAAPDAGSAAAAIAKDFLRPAPKHLERRVAEYTGMNPGASIPAIMEIMADPYAPQGDKMVLGALLEQQLAQMQPPDPMQALELERAQLEIDAMRNPQMAGPPQVETFYDEATGQQYKAQWDGQGWVPVGGVQAADGPMVDMSGLQIGGAGTGQYVYGTDAGVPAGWRVDTVTGVASPIPGGPAAVEQEQLASKGGKKDAQVKLKLGSTLENISLNIAEIEDGGLPVTGVAGDARRTGLGRALTGDSAVDFANRTNQITDSAALAEVQNMRDNSPTGGAVGSLTDNERRAIGNSVTAMNSSTSAKEYVRAAKAYQKLALDIAYGEGRWQMDQTGNVISGGAAPSLELTDDDLFRQYGINP